MAASTMSTICLLVNIILIGLISFPSSRGEGATDKKEENHGTVIGIDLGTTYSCVGVFKDGHVEIIANDQGNRITPSYVAFTSEGERLIGDAAKNQLTTNHENTVFDVKRLIGRTWDEPSVHSDIEYLPYKVIDKDSKPFIKVSISFHICIMAVNKILKIISQ